MLKKQYPDKTRFSNYTIVRETQKGADGEPRVVATIRRTVYIPGENPKPERYPTKLYAHVRNNKRELEAFVIRLNKGIPEEVRTRREVKIKHAWINDKLLEEYHTFLIGKANVKATAETEFHYLKTYALHYFINVLNLASPIDWKRQESKWGAALMNKADGEKIPLLWEDRTDRAPTTLKHIRDALNHFIEWLHRRDIATYPLLKFDPFSKSQLKDLRARRVVNGEARIRKIIRKPSWELIQAKLPKDGRLWAGVNLAYHYGLRLGEILGLHPDDIRQGRINLERQLVRYTKDGGPEWGPLKGRGPRKVPHWYCEPKQAVLWSREIQKNLASKSDFGREVAEWLQSIGLDHTLHDFRHTWCSIVIKTHTPGELMEAAGHKDLNTTNQYLHLGEDYDEDAPFILVDDDDDED